MGLLNGKTKRKRRMNFMPPFDRIVHDALETAIWMSSRRKSFSFSRVVSKDGERKFLRTFRAEDIRPLLRLLRDTALWFSADHSLSRELRVELQTLAEAIDAADTVTTESDSPMKRTMPS